MSSHPPLLSCLIPPGILTIIQVCPTTRTSQSIPAIPVRRYSWTNYSTEDIGLTPGKYLLNGSWYLIGADGLPVYMKAGINKVGGKFYYAAKAGSYFTGDLSEKAGYCVFSDGREQKLSDKFNVINSGNNSTLFYWILNSAEAKELTAGLNWIDGTAYWADEAGYVIRNNFGKGVVSLGGKYYLSSGYCDIVTKGTAYTSDTAKPSTIDLRGHTYEFKLSDTVQNMYYIKSDYSLACNEWVEYLYFGKDCAYTSGNETIDAAVWAVVKDFINNSSLTRVQKLLKAYNYIRGGAGETEGPTPFKYRRHDGMVLRARYNGQVHYAWALNAAFRMFTQKNGMCYEWAAAYLYMAKRLGFQAYPVVGSIFSKTTQHCWCMIRWNNQWHISDVEIEWGYISGYYGTGQKVYRNSFDILVTNEFFSSFKHPECDLTYWVWDERE